MWNYQEILFELRPHLIVEFGTYRGGSALYFANVLSAIGEPYRVLTVDINQKRVDDRVRKHVSIEVLEADSTGESVRQRITELRHDFPGPVFCILDSDHRMQHVLSELLALREVTTAGDYVVVEDGNLNGHPVLPGWGSGPFEAIEEYFTRHPDDYVVDRKREGKFGFTFAPGGFLMRR
jgi:cephalosporin hydroxylase